MISCASVYHHEIPAFLNPYLETDAMQRLKRIDMNCGMNYTSCPRFVNIEPYSRFHHSLGCALIVWHFTNRKEETLAALFHDIASPVFSHVIDFLHHDYLNQESTEEKTAWIIAHDPGIMDLLHKDGICVEQVSDYHMYPIADNDSPRLCADRLEYLLGDMLDYKLCGYEEVKTIYEDLVIGKNEDGEDELCFANRNTASQFSHYSLDCGRIYSGDENRYAMELLARILNKAIGQGILDEEDLYRGEDEVMELLENSPLREEIQRFSSLCAVKRVNAYEEGALRVDAKKRYADPLVYNQGRISELDEELREDIAAFRNTSYDYWLKGMIL